MQPHPMFAESISTYINCIPPVDGHQDFLDINLRRDVSFYASLPPGVCQPKHTTSPVETHHRTDRVPLHC